MQINDKGLDYTSESNFLDTGKGCVKVFLLQEK